MREKTACIYANSSRGTNFHSIPILLLFFFFSISFHSSHVCECHFWSSPIFFSRRIFLQHRCCPFSCSTGTRSRQQPVPVFIFVDYLRKSSSFSLAVRSNKFPTQFSICYIPFSMYQVLCCISLFLYRLNGLFFLFFGIKSSPTGYSCLITERNEEKAYLNLSLWTSILDHSI